jgi:hypothetical protein
VITSVWIVPLLLISGFQRVELPVDRLWLMTVLSLNEQLFVLAFNERELRVRDLHFVVDNGQSFRLAGLANRQRQRLAIR